MIAKDQRNKQAWLGAGKALYGLKRSEDALKCIRKALQLDGKFQAAHEFEELVLKGAPLIEGGSADDSKDDGQFEEL